MPLSFRQFIEVQQDSTPPDLYGAASDELGTQDQIGIISLNDWVPFGDHLRFGQMVNARREDDVVMVKPIGDYAMKCCRRITDASGKEQYMQIECPKLDDSREFPIKEKEFRQIVNKPFAQPQGGMGAGGMGGMGGLPGM